MKLTVVGSGPAGLYSALTASEQGAKVTLVDRSERLGGTCVLFGCIPSKAMMSPLFLSYAARKYGKSVEFSYSELEDLARSVVQRVSKGVEYMLESAGVEVVRGEAELHSGKVQVGGQSLESDAVVVATGTEKPNIPGTIASDDLHFLDRGFNSVLLIGGGVGGVEYGWLLHLAGKKVTIVEREDQLLPGHDRDLRVSVTSHFKRLGIDVRTNSTAEISERVKINGQPGDFDLVVFTFGRKPAVKGFEDLVGNKWISVNEYMETKVNRVYAAGDVTGTFTAHEAIHKGIVAGLNATGLRRRYRGDAVPKVLYTHPEIAYVGATEGKCVKLSMTEVVRAVAEKSTEGFIKVCVNEDGTLRGGVAFSERAEDIISMLALLMQLHVNVQDARELMVPHPSYLEGLWEALRRLKP
ncbi:NAD(P)/FAD-dependent oxidoreductase [Metallosphaera javensis (ex Sakai et al. 2022)]|uniref:NAD(P)/FAD-dependent oxidoreductase n=1 Tax=Metallosphaera javensis (ex Sakai et al. 2022) TaxID=2775498 RepID=UPI00258C3A81|nr:MAG: dihydrolipoyl dehydrogenase [Metallosphaera javensis (ex Sakai et al. 2022)]